MIRVKTEKSDYGVAICTFREAVAGLPEGSVIISDQNVWKHWGNEAGHFPAKIVSPGEGSKSLHTYESVLEWLAENRIPRSATIVALGGGVIGDLAGFVAATYMRGVDLIQIPTSLLAQVDSSVGGKVGLDLKMGKNLVGAFHQPKQVFVPTDTLKTLEDRHFTNGMAEVVKYGLILSKPLSDDLLEPLERPSERLPDVIQQCISLKAKVVMEDEFDRTGQRAILNFGHTIGHAIEHLSGYGPILHGEAISIGMVVEAELGERIGVTEKGVAREVQRRLSLYGLPTDSPVLERTEELIDAMRRDKKTERPGELGFSLLTGIGGCKLVSAIPEAEVRALLIAR